MDMQTVMSIMNGGGMNADMLAKAMGGNSQMSQLLPMLMNMNKKSATEYTAPQEFKSDKQIQDLTLYF